MRTIYLSPSNKNEICREISNYLKSKLIDYGYNVYICDENSSIEERIENSAKLNVDAYLSFHIREKYSNEFGPYLIYGKNYLSKDISKSIFNQLKLIYPYNINHTNIEENFNIIEVSKVSVPLCFIEFLSDDIQWLVKNKINIANSIAIGINEYFKNIN